MALVWLIGASSYAAVDQATSRGAARKPVFGSSQGRSTTGLIERLDFIGDVQFSVTWLAPRDNSPLPPGVTREQLEQHRFVISPALRRALTENHSSRFADAGTISEVGLKEPDELLAYARLGRSTTNVTRPVTAFGGSAGEPEVQFFPFIFATLIFLVLPGVLLLAVCLSSRSEGYTYRCQLLGRLGVTRRQIGFIGAVEGTILALVGSVAAAFIHGAWARSAESIPILGRDVFRGDLVLSPMAECALLVAVVVVAALIGAANAVLRSRPVSTTRPAATIARRPTLRMVPLALGLTVLIAVIAAGDPQTQVRWLLISAFLVLVGIPLILPLIGAGIGRLLGESKRLSVWMAGRRLERDPESAMRPLLLSGAALTVALGVVGYISAVDHIDPPARAGDMQVALIRYPTSVAPAHLAGLSTQSLAIVPFDQTTWTLDASCSELAQRSADPHHFCAPGGTLSIEARTAIGRSLSSARIAQDALHLGPVHPGEGASQTAVAIGVSRPGFAGTVRSIVEPIDATEVSERVEFSHRPAPPLVKWLLSGFAIAGFMSMVALLILSVERYSRTLGSHRVLQALGIPPRVQAQIEITQFATCALTTVGVAFAAGTVFALMITRTARVEAPLAAITWIGVGALTAVGLCTTVIAAVARVKFRRSDSVDPAKGQARWTM